MSARHPRSFWQDELAGFGAPSALWRDASPGRASESGRPRRIGRRDGPSTASVEAFCRRHDLGLGDVVRGAWAVLLAVYGREEDVLFGFGESSGSSWLRPERATVRWEEKVDTWLRTLAEASAIRAPRGPVALGDLQGWSDVPEGLPLFESVVWIGDAAPDHESWPLVVGVRPGRRLQLWADADGDRFDDWTLAHLLLHLDRVLVGLVSDPPPALGDVELLDGPERERLLVEWNDTAVDHRPDATIPDLFAEQVAVRPDRPAVECGDTVLTYAELDVRANRLAHYLQRLGVGPDVPVGICVERTETVIVALLGILKAGGAYLALDASHPPERLRFMLEDAGAPVFVTERALAGQVGETAVRPVVLEDVADELAREKTTPPACQATARHLAYIAYTSGSTGHSQGRGDRPPGGEPPRPSRRLCLARPGRDCPPGRPPGLRCLDLRGLGSAPQRRPVRGLSGARPHDPGLEGGDRAPWRRHPLADVQPLQCPHRRGSVLPHRSGPAAHRRRGPLGGPRAAGAGRPARDPDPERLRAHRVHDLHDGPRDPAPSRGGRRRHSDREADSGHPVVRPRWAEKARAHRGGRRAVRRRRGPGPWLPRPRRPHRREVRLQSPGR